MAPLIALLEYSDFAVIAVIAVVAGIVVSSLSSYRSDIRRLDRKLEVILQQLGIASKLDASDEVKRLVSNPENKIDAIRLHREQTGVGLAEAKADVEAIFARRKY